MTATEEPQRTQLDAAQLLTAPPRGTDDDSGETAGELEYALLELALDFPSLDVLPERHALWTRLFVLTRDPLSWILGRGHAWVTPAINDRMLELDVYIELGEIERAREGGEELGVVLGRFGETAIKGALRYEPLLAGGEETPSLLKGIDEYAAGFGVPQVRVRSAGWEPVGLGALQDLVRDAFGDVALDREPVALAPVERLDAGCPACQGNTFGFPSGLDRAISSMCSAHRAAADAEHTIRLARARDSNPAGWRAIDRAAARVSGSPEPSFAPQPKRAMQSVARNEPCPCGSGKKYKRCHGA